MINPVFSKYVPKFIKEIGYSILFAGNKFTCPFCLSSFRKLKYIGEDFAVLKEKKVVGAGRRRAGCWTCGSSDRERLIYLFLKHEFNLFSSRQNKILHIAPEINLAKKLQESTFSTYIKADNLEPGYEYDKSVTPLDLRKIAFNDNSFSLIICNHVLEHIPDDIKALNEIYRVLSWEGVAILQVPFSINSKTTIEDLSITSPAEKQMLFGQEDHVRIYGEDYFLRLKNCGFIVDRINISNHFPKFGLNPSEEVFVCRKHKTFSSQSQHT